MVVSKFKKLFIKFTGYWFLGTAFKHKSKSDVVIFHSLVDLNYCPNSLYYTEDQYSLVSDLTFDEEALFKKNSKTCRYEINRAKKSDVFVRHIDSSELKKDPEILKNFENDYYSFIKEKNIDDTYNKEAVNSYIDSETFCLTLTEMENGIKIWHSYIYDDKNARLMYSVSNFRSEKKIQALAGMVNRLQHWQDMLTFKNCGVTHYDWGGVPDFEFNDGIAKFKKSFGGDPLKTKTYIIASSFIGKIVVLAMKITHK